MGLQVHFRKLGRAMVARVRNRLRLLVRIVRRRLLARQSRHAVAVQPCAIDDITGRHVAGPGVVGEQPRLKPREAFRYTSGCPLSTSSGEMRGTYQMLTDEGVSFEVEVPAFSLHLPGAHRVVN